MYACVYHREGLLRGALDKWRCHMVRPDVLVSYVPSSSKTKPGATIGLLYSVRPDNPSVSCLPRWCIVGIGYFSDVFAKYDILKQTTAVHSLKNKTLLCCNLSQSCKHNPFLKQQFERCLVPGHEIWVSSSRELDNNLLIFLIENIGLP